MCMDGGSLELVTSVPSYLVSLILPARCNGLSSISTLRCDHCRGKLDLDVHYYGNMRFCCPACVTAYQQRLAPQTKVKISNLDVAA
jgi:phage FluMu protein Com